MTSDLRMKPKNAQEFFRPDIGLSACAFCLQEKQLQLSHVLPKFVFRWLRETSGTGHLRVSHTPNRRAQDGWKVRMLCWDCEQLFGTWEKAFAELAFYPLHEDRFASVDYGPWLSRFAAAQSWRVLQAYMLRNGLPEPFPQSLLPSVERALTKWKKFLLGEELNAGVYEQHALRVDIIKETTMREMPSNMNRYLARTVDIDVASGWETGFVYSKLARIIIVGFIQMPRRTRWRGTRISPTYGRFGSSDVRVPGEFGEFLLSKARRMADSAARISGEQRRRISEAVREDPSRAAKSEIAEAMMQDITLFGQRAFEESEDE